MKIAAFLEDTGTNEESTLLQALRKHSHPHTMQIERFSSMKIIQQCRAIPNIIVVNWSMLKNPIGELNEFIRDSKLEQVPLIAVAKTILSTDQCFLSEINRGPMLVENLNSELTAENLFQAMLEVFDNNQPVARRNAQYRALFSIIKNKPSSIVQQVFAEREHQILDLTDRGVFWALVLRKANKSKEAIIQARNTLVAMPFQHPLRVHLLDLLGQFYVKANKLEEAERFLREACELSPGRLERRFLLGQCYVEMEVPHKALPHYSAVYRIDPEYPGIHTRFAEVIYVCSRGPDDLQAINPLFARFSDRELVSFYKRITSYVDVHHSPFMMDMIVREFSLRANQFIGADDFYAALKPYKHIEQIIDPQDVERQHLLSYCYARVYYRADEIELASKYINRAIDLAEQPKAKHLQLKKLIDKRLGIVKKASA